MFEEVSTQGHNFKLTQAYDRLDQLGVKNDSAKPDCFTILLECEAKSGEVFHFDQGIGIWRVSKESDIICSFDIFKTEMSSKTLN